MTIQAAIRACCRRKNLFARPKSWKGSGEAVDLGKRCNSNRIMKINVIHSKAFLTTERNILPAELLCSWEVIPSTTLAEEVEKSVTGKNRETG